MLNKIKQYFNEKKLLNFNKAIVSAQTAYSDDPNLLRPLDQEISEGRGFAKSKFGPVFSAVRLMSETLARAPLYIGKREDGNPNSQGAWDKDHVLNEWNSVLNRPNPFYAPQTFWEAFFTTLLITGNVYCLIRRQNDLPVSLHFAEFVEYNIRETPDEAGRIRRMPFYKLNVYREDGKRNYSVEVPGRDVLNVHGPNYNVSRAKSPSPLQQAILKSLKMYEGTLDYQYKNLSKGVGAKGIISLKSEDYTAEKLDQVMNKVKEIAGISAGQPWQVMPPNVEITPLDNEAIDNSIFQALSFSIDEVARIYNIPAQLIGGTNLAGLGTGITTMMSYFVNNALHPYAQRLEEAIYDKIMVMDDKKDGYVCRLDLSSVSGGTLTDKITNAERLVKSMLSSPNEARSMLLGLPPMEGGDNLMPFAGAAPSDNRDDEERREQENPDAAAEDNNENN